MEEGLPSQSASQAVRLNQGQDGTWTVVDTASAGPILARLRSSAGPGSGDGRPVLQRPLAAPG